MCWNFSQLCPLLFDINKDYKMNDKRHCSLFSLIYNTHNQFVRPVIHVIASQNRWLNLMSDIGHIGSQCMSLNHLSPFVQSWVSAPFLGLLAGAESQSWCSQPLIILWLLAQGETKGKKYVPWTHTCTHPRTHIAIIPSGVEDIACTDTHPCLTSGVTLLPSFEHRLELL